MSDIINVNNFNYNNYLINYNNFIQQLKIIFSKDQIQVKLDELLNLPDNLKIKQGILFSESISNDYFNDFVKSKLKIFSHKSPDTQKMSESLFGTHVSLKNLLNNQPEEVKTIIWNNLHDILLTVELFKPIKDRNLIKISTLSKLLNKNIYEPINEDENNKSNAHVKNSLKDMLGVEVNNETTGMLNDIIATFEDILTGNAGTNPFSGIMQASQKISEKYANKINNGEIELDKIMKSISSKVPGMDMMLSSMSNGASEKTKEKIIIDDNFSTANIEVGINEEDKKSNINLGNVLKLADQFGVIPGGKQSESSMPNFSALGGGMSEIPNIGKMIEIMQKLGNTETTEDAELLKHEMDSFLQKDLGLDIDKLNKDLEAVQIQMAKSNLDNN